MAQVQLDILVIIGILGVIPAVISYAIMYCLKRSFYKKYGYWPPPVG